MFSFKHFILKITPVIFVKLLLESIFFCCSRCKRTPLRSLYRKGWKLRRRSHSLYQARSGISGGMKRQEARC